MLLQRIKCHDNATFTFMTTKVGRNITNSKPYNLQKLDMLRQYTNCNLFVKQIRSILYPYSRLIHSNERYDKSDNCVYSNYILKMLNNEAIDFRRYQVPQSLAIKLHLYREKYGPYKSLKDILKVQDMTKEILDKFIKSIVDDKQFKIKQNFKKSIIIPSTNIPQEEISTVLGIYVGTNIISWTLLESEKNILEWNYENFLEVPKNYDTFQLLKLAWNVKLKIPKADVYVMDETNFNYNLLKSAKYMQGFLQKEKLKAMILAFLSENNFSQENNTISSLTKNVYLLKHEKLAKLFNLYVGNEVVSSSSIINKLLYEKDSINNEDKHPIGVYITKYIMHRYNNQMNYIKDQMNWSLLIALTFLQLGVLKKYDYDFV